MKRPVIISILRIVLIPLLIISTSFKWTDHCNTDALLKEVHEKFQDYTLLKDYIVTIKAKTPDQTENPTLSFPITLTNGLKYKFAEAVSDESAGKMTMNLFYYDIDGKKHIEISNVQKDKRFNALEFVCHSSGIYLIEFSYDGLEGCGVASSGFTLNK